MEREKTYWTRVMRRDTGETVSQYTHATQEQVDEYKLAYGNSKIWRLIIRPSDMPILQQYKGPTNFGWLPFAPIVNKEGKEVKMSEIGYNWIK